MAMYFTKDEISCPKCGNTILLKEEYVILKKTKNGLLPEKVKTKFICKDCKEVVYEQLPNFE